MRKTHLSIFRALHSSFPEHWPPHARINLFNQYEDFTSGLNFLLQRTPFSGAGILIDAPELSGPVKFQANGSLLLTIGTGFFFMERRLPVGLPGILD
ncbi:MAG: hypothetical protein ACU826_04115 [Gammaproteobacteria bacterium]